MTHHSLCQSLPCLRSSASIYESSQQTQNLNKSRQRTKNYWSCLNLWLKTTCMWNILPNVPLVVKNIFFTTVTLPMEVRRTLDSKELLMVLMAFGESSFGELSIPMAFHGSLVIEYLWSSKEHQRILRSVPSKELIHPWFKNQECVFFHGLWRDFK